MSDPFAYLFGLEQFGIKFGLDNIRHLLGALDHPERTFRSIHIAGTNGKGSVTALVDHALRSAGHRSGRYTSPHLVDVSERFVIEGRAVDHASLASAIQTVRNAIDTLLAHGTLDAPPTFFEATTAVAFELFRRAAVQFAVCEVGLGGRLDATNALEPVVTAITTIAFDHQQYLGHTLEDIAREKAGIIKPRTPVVIGAIPPPALAVIEAIAHEREAPVTRALVDVELDVREPGRLRLRTPQTDYGGMALALRGRHQVENAVVAVRILETLRDTGVVLPAPAVVDALSHVTWPGRIDIRRLPDGHEVLLDAAHNRAGAAALATFAKDNDWIGATLVFTAMKDKDVDEMLRELLPIAGRVIFTRASNPRSADPVALLERAAAVHSSTPGIQVDNASAAFERALSLSQRVIVAGSIFLLGDLLPVVEARDTLR
jgi:dihydrofolate synthase/folylpolyglutamate synthase